jgi:hypothetical protein
VVAEVRDDRLAGGARTGARAAELGPRVLLPALRGGPGPMIAALIYVPC